MTIFLDMATRLNAVGQTGCSSLCFGQWKRIRNRVNRRARELGCQTLCQAAMRGKALLVSQLARGRAPTVGLPSLQCAPPMAEASKRWSTEIADRVQRPNGGRPGGGRGPLHGSPPQQSQTRATQPPAPRTCVGCSTQGTCGTYQLVKGGAARVTPSSPPRTSSDIAPYIDHTLLKPDATHAELKKLCDEACRYGFATVCVNSSNVPLPRACWRGAATVPIAVVGFPLGAALPSAKAFEAREAVRAGAREIDMVINIGALKSRDYPLVLDDIRAVVEASKPWPVEGDPGDLPARSGMKRSSPACFPRRAVRPS